MLDKFRAAKEKEINDLAQAERRGTLLKPYDGPRPDFKKAILSAPGIAVIAEYKRASPSLGPICASLDVEDAASQYRAAGAKAISILTEERYFDGRLKFLADAARALNNSTPLLRKDFIFDPLQIMATAASPASSLLLIARFFNDASELRELRELSEKSGIDAVVEIFDETDLKIAREAGASIIQVNARDLDTFKVNRQLCLELIKKASPDGHEIWIAASGMDKAEHIRMAQDAGFNAALIGTALMKNGTPGAALATLLREGGQC